MVSSSTFDSLGNGHREDFHVRPDSQIVRLSNRNRKSFRLVKVTVSFVRLASRPLDVRIGRWAGF